MLKPITKGLFVSVALFGAFITDAKSKDWSEREAVAEAQHDIRSNNIKFCYWGGYAPQPVGVIDQYFSTVAKYPKVMVGQGCVVYDEALNARQRVYAETYNTRMLAYLLKKK
jgi:hypothetical protein